MAGTSGTPLPNELGVKEGQVIALLGAPEGFELNLDGMLRDVDLRWDLRRADLDLVLFFARRRAELIRRLPLVARAIARHGGVWICWPSASSGVRTDLSDEVVRRSGIDAGLVDDKACAIDEVWSGLRFVCRLEDR